MSGTEKRKMHYLNRTPAENDFNFRPAVLAEFASRLQHHMTRKGWNQSETARQAALHMPDKKFGRDNVSNYVRGLVMPGPLHLEALAKALGVKPDDLLPHREAPNAEQSVSPVTMTESGDGRVWLRINQTTDYKTALKVLSLLKGDQE